MRKMNLGRVAVLLLACAAALAAGQDHDDMEGPEWSPKFDLWSDADPLDLQGTDDDENYTDEEAERWCDGETACNKTCPLLGYKTGHDGECFMCTCRHSGIFEGDILVKETEYNRLLRLYGKTETSGRAYRAADDRRAYKWPADAEGIVNIPYEEDLNPQISKLLKQAFERYHDQTCLRFVARADQRDYLLFKGTPGCASYIGRIGGKQEVVVGNCGVGSIMHELMHAIGFWHEQSRPDRDDYITVVDDNIVPNYKHNFQKMKEAWNDFGSAYDYNSLTHYGGYYFAKHYNSPTLINKQTGEPISRYPNRKGFSVQDLYQINQKYNCTTSSHDRLRTTTPVTTTTAAPTTVTIPEVAPYSGACGITSSALQYDLPQNIVGGITSTYGAIPWQVAIFTMYGNRNTCGATLISNQYILSSANCFRPFYRPAYFYVMLGRHSREFYKHDVGQVITLLSSIIVHENYDKRTLNNDIAIAKLKEPVQFTNYIRPVCLPSPQDGGPTEGTKALVSGWGDTQERDFRWSATTFQGRSQQQNTVWKWATYRTNRNEQLQQVDVRVIGSWMCNEWMMAKRRMVDGDTMLCAGYENGGKDTGCTGDLGAPLVIKKGQANVLIGISSWGFGCARKRSPGVYTKVSKYLTWITRNAV